MLMIVSRILPPRCSIHAWLDIILRCINSNRPVTPRSLPRKPRKLCATLAPGNWVVERASIYLQRPHSQAPPGATRSHGWISRWCTIRLVGQALPAPRLEKLLSWALYSVCLPVLVIFQHFQAIKKFTCMQW
jgi:hypothetical protein